MRHTSTRRTERLRGTPINTQGSHPGTPEALGAGRASIKSRRALGYFTEDEIERLRLISLSEVEDLVTRITGRTLGTAKKWTAAALPGFRAASRYAGPPFPERVGTHRGGNPSWSEDWLYREADILAWLDAVLKFRGYR